MIKRFAENHPKQDQPKQCWYETEKGTRKPCDVAMIHLLWQEWILKGKEKQFENGFTVFVFEKPVDSTRLKNWIDE